MSEENKALVRREMEELFNHAPHPYAHAPF
jgi:hypothetical protein